MTHHPTLLSLAGLLVLGAGAHGIALGAAGDDQIWATQFDLLAAERILAWHLDEHPAADAPEEGCVELGKLASRLPEIFRKRMPARDAWGHRLRACTVDGSLHVVSPGPDGIVDFDEEANPPEAARPSRHLLAVATVPPAVREDGQHAGDDIVVAGGKVVAGGLRTTAENLALTMRDLRTIGTSVEEYSIDNNRYPTLPEGAGTVAGLTSTLQPVYVRRLPVLDAWGADLYYWSDGLSYVIVSPGTDGTLDRAYGPDSPHLDYAGEYRDPTIDLVFGNGTFLQWPRGSTR